MKLATIGYETAILADLIREDLGCEIEPL